jgi:cystathionine beta-lyase/cystathionine gamma-synthase
MGVVCTNRLDLYERLRFVQNSLGAVPSPFDCFLAHRGLKTLHLRMEASARYVPVLLRPPKGHTDVSSARVRNTGG